MLNELNKQMAAVYESMSDTSLSDEQREAKTTEMNKLQEKMVAGIKESIKQNITNTVGIHLLKNNFYYLKENDLEPLLPQIPAQYKNDETIVKIN